VADFVFNIAKGKVAYYAGLPAANDALVVVPLASAGLGTDATLMDADTLTQVLASATEQTTMGRKSLTAAAITVDDANDRVDVDIADPTWPTAGGSAVGALVICYDPDTTGGTDADLIPLTKHDFAVAPNGGDITAQVAASGFYRAS